MKKIFENLFHKELNLRALSRAEQALRQMSITEKVFFYVASFIFCLSSILLLHKLNDAFLVEIPAHGGTLTEGIIGTPRFINPLLALSDADRDLTTLVYAGLMKTTSSGTIIPDLAESYAISEDGLNYTFILKDDAYFSDGTQVTTDDIEFTIQKAQDSVLKSPRRASWEGVIIEKKSDKEITFKLKQPYAPFIENTTIGILPKHIWKSIESEQFAFSQFNVNPIGAGAYSVDSIKRTDAGIPTEYTLTAESSYVGGEPYISKLIVRFFQSEQALSKAFTDHTIDSVSGLSADNTYTLNVTNGEILQVPLTRVFSIFFDQNNSPALLDPAVRKALDISINRDTLITEVLHNFGTKATGPLPRNGEKVTTSTTTQAEDSLNYKEDAETILTKAGWTKNETTGIFEKKDKKTTTKLSVSLSTSNVPELIKTARLVEDTWTKLGVDVNVKIFEVTDLQQMVIRGRKYEALLFGTVSSRIADPYAFWHSSQRNDPGLNIALYTNKKIDSLIEDIRTTLNDKERDSKYTSFETELKKDTPALFLYSPDYIYVIPNTLKGVELERVVTPSDRFVDIQNWYVKTDKVWSVYNRYFNTK